jgi:hypothetical protein
MPGHIELRESDRASGSAPLQIESLRRSTGRSWAGRPVPALEWLGEDARGRYGLASGEQLRHVGGSPHVDSPPGAGRR